MKKAYPVFIKKGESAFDVYIPDFDGFTQGEDFCDAMEMARDYIGGAIVGTSGEETNTPEPSEQFTALAKAKDMDDWFSDGVFTYVDIDVEAYRSEIRNISVKKNCTLPYWLERKAESAGINFSQVLQEALKEKLQIA